jgi:hypothetical protein
LVALIVYIACGGLSLVFCYLIDFDCEPGMSPMKRKVSDGEMEMSGQVVRKFDFENKIQAD